MVLICNGIRQSHLRSWHFKALMTVQFQAHPQQQMTDVIMFCLPWPIWDQRGSYSSQQLESFTFSTPQSPRFFTSHDTSWLIVFSLMVITINKQVEKVCKSPYSNQHIYNLCKSDYIYICIMVITINKQVYINQATSIWHEWLTWHEAWMALISPPPAALITSNGSCEVCNIDGSNCKPYETRDFSRCLVLTI